MTSISVEGVKGKKELNDLAQSHQGHSDSRPEFQLIKKDVLLLVLGGVVGESQVSPQLKYAPCLVMPEISPSMLGPLALSF